MLTYEYGAAGHLTSVTGAFGIWIVSDHRSAPRALVDAQGEVVWRWDSDPFGTTSADEHPDGDGSAVTFPLRLPGQYFDAETGLHHNRFRNYDPRTGRYLEPDPLGVRASVNVYAYASADPINWTDPMGLQAVDVPATVGAVDLGPNVKGFNLLKEALTVDVGQIVSEAASVDWDGPINVIFAHGTEDADGWVDGKDVGVGNKVNANLVRDYDRFVNDLIREGKLPKDAALYLFTCGVAHTCADGSANAATKVANAYARAGGTGPVIGATEKIEYIPGIPGHVIQPDRFSFPPKPIVKKVFGAACKVAAVVATAVAAPPIAVASTAMDIVDAVTLIEEYALPEARNRVRSRTRAHHARHIVGCGPGCENHRPLAPTGPDSRDCRDCR
ncbi:MAG: hypothetical protein IPK13_02765 [Deltaproteobacteria bacterium]|nr:hypothetical protein [Deltaproteobacteria bacterium]